MLTGVEYSVEARLDAREKRSWGEVLTVIASALHLANFPLGTFVGAASLWVLLGARVSPIRTSRAELISWNPLQDSKFNPQTERPS